MMDMQAAPPTYTPAGGARPPTGNPPMLGAQVPGMTGGLPAQGGLSVLANPMAQQLQSYGRGDDSMLVHMTPDEVNSLQGLAMAAGGSLTINPDTGLPEAGWLGDLLPTLLGIGASFIPGVGPLAAAALIGGGTAAVTGDLSKGLMAGLGAFGGGALGGALQGAGAAGAAGAGVAGAAGTGAATGAGAAGVGNILTGTGSAIGSGLSGIGGSLAPATLGAVAPTALAIPAGLAAPAASLAAPAGSAVAKMGLSPALAASAPLPQLASAATPALGQVATGMPGPGFLSRFGQQATSSMAKAGAPAFLTKNAPMIAGTGILSGLSDAMQPSMSAPEEEKSTYAGPYSYAPREVSYPSIAPEISGDSSEHKYFSRSQLLDAAGNPAFGVGTPAGGLGNLKGMESILSKLKKQDKYAEGGEVNMARGSFVADARTVSELGNGSSGAGQELLARMGGRPLRGPGDGVSDSIPARIGSDQPARVARDEVLFSPEAVRRIGKGSEKRGAQKLYALMDKAHKARKKAKRGQDTGLRKGLA